MQKEKGKRKKKIISHPTLWLGDCRITSNPLGDTADPHLKHPSACLYGNKFTNLWGELALPSGCVRVCKNQF